ncbi:hypothetical protein ACRAWG_15100 [Methylobacterium sp. P31]
MSALFRAFNPTRLAALTRAGTILGGTFSDLPPLPLSSRDVELPPAPAATPISVFDERHIRRHRADVLWARRTGKRFLGPEEWRFLGQLARWKAPLSIAEADRLAMLVDRVDSQRRGLL